MKKRFMSLLTVAATLVMGFSNCSNDDNVVVENGKGRVVSLKVSAGSASTRAEEASQTGQSTSIDGTKEAAVYFLNAAGGVTDFIKIYTNATAGSNISVGNLISGHTFTGISANASQVYIVANIPTATVSTALAAASTKTAIEAVQLSITDFTTISSVTMKGSGTISAPAAPSTTYTASVALAPVVARFEIAKVEYDAQHASSSTNSLTKFELKGIFVNNHYKAMGMNFAPTTLYNSSVAADYTATNFPAPLAGLTGTYAGAAGTLSYVPATGACWAYQFFPVDAATGGQPMLVFELDVTDAAGTLTGHQFISVNRFETPGGVAITKFDANHIYKISSLKFSNRNLAPNPGVALKDVTVTVTVTPWVDVNINPIV